MGFDSNLKKLIDIYGVVASIEVISVMLTQEIETIDELNDCILDELSYAAESN